MPCKCAEKYMKNNIFNLYQTYRFSCEISSLHIISLPYQISTRNFNNTNGRGAVVGQVVWFYFAWKKNFIEKQKVTTPLHVHTPVLSILGRSDQPKFQNKPS